MRIARKIMLLAVMALTAMALSATTASAQTEVEVDHEPTGANCSPCEIHVVGESRIQTETGVVVSRCNDEFEGTINNNGTGEVEWNGATDIAPGCNTVNCAAPADHWTIDGVTEVAGFEVLVIEFCLQPLGGGAAIPCDGSVQAADDSTHHYVFSLNQECSTNRVVIGSWEIEDTTHDGIELIHHD